MCYHIWRIEKSRANITRKFTFANTPKLTNISICSVLIITFVSVSNLYQHSIAFVLSVALLLSVMIQTGMLINYHLNTQEYTEKYCENKAQPELNCQGSCHLSKQLQLANGNEYPTSEETVLVSLIAFQDIRAVELTSDIQRRVVAFFSLPTYFTTAFKAIVFRPPII